MRTTIVDLKKLIDDSIYIIRWAKSNYKNPAVMWSTGKDSTTMLHLIKTAFLGKVPFPVIHLDTGCKFPEIYEFRDMIAKEWNLNLIVGTNEEALKNLLKKHKFDALIMSIRRDEHYIRNMERYFSPRDKDGIWRFVRTKSEEEMKEGDAPFVSEQPLELFNLFQTDFGPNCSHVRVHPILHWTELDVWRYIKKNNIPFNPLYRSDYVKKKFGWKNKRFRSLGCQPCTVPVDSSAKIIDDIIEELKTTEVEERSGRSQDKEKEQVMRRLRTLGYM